MNFILDWGEAIVNFGGATKAAIGASLDSAKALPAWVPFHGVRHVEEITGGRAVDYGKVPLEALNTVYREGFSEPISSLATAARLSRQEALRTEGSWWDRERAEFGTFFDADTWRKAYDLAQTTSIGQATVEAYYSSAFNPVRQAELRRLDPTDEQYQRTFARMREESAGYNIASGTLDFAANWRLDPLVGVGKVYGAFRSSFVRNPVRPGDDLSFIGVAEAPEFRSAREVLGEVRTYSQAKTAFEELAKKRRLGSVYRRTEDVIREIRGRDANYILNAVDGLKQSTNGPALAGALAKAGRQADTREARLVLRLAYGDSSAMAELAARNTEIADMVIKAADETNELVNAAKFEGGFAYYKRPDVQKKVRDRLANIKTLTDDLAAERSRLDYYRENVLDVAKGPQSLRVTAKSRDRGQRAAEGIRPLTIGGRAVERDKEIGQGFIQKSLWNIPVRVVNFPRDVRRAMTTMRPQGWAFVDDPSSAHEVQAMLDKVPDLDPSVRTKLLGEYIEAVDPGVRYQVIDRAKAAVMAHKARQYGYTEEQAEKIVNSYLMAERRWLGPRAASPQRYTAARDEQGRFADIIVDENGIPTSLPQLKTQLANAVPMLNVDYVDRALKRNKNAFQAFAKWIDESGESAGRYAASRVTRRADRARWDAGEAGIDLANIVNRWWKFSVLLRLGYPMRVLFDDALRTHAKLGSAAVALDVEKAFAGVKAFGRGVTAANYRAARAALTSDVARRDELEAELAALDDEKLGAKMFEMRVSRASRRRSEAPKRGTGPGFPTYEKTISVESGFDPEANDAAVRAIHEELDEIAGRLAMAKEKGAVKAYEPQRGQRLGEGELEHRGVRLDDAFAGADADLRRMLSSGRGMHDTLLWGAENKAYQRSTRTGGGWVAIEPHEPGHREAWLHAVNTQLRQDELASRFIAGESREQVAKWLTRTAEGRSYARSLPWHASDRDAWLGTVESMVNQYVPDAGWRELLAERQLRDADIQAYIDKGGPAPAVHGSQLEAQLGKGPAARMLNNAQSRIMNALSDLPSDVISRHPLYVALYRQKAREEIDFLLADPNRGLLGKADRIDQDDLKRVYKSAHAHALKELRNTLYDISAHSNAAETLRFVSPFMGAWQETLRRWWGLAEEKPELIGYFNLAWNMPNKAGLIVDRDGNPVDESTELSDDEYLLIQLPPWMGGPTDENPLRGQLRLPKGVGEMVMSIPKASFNLVLQGDPWWLPGVGPMLQIPLGYLAKKRPSTGEILRFVNPYGPPKDTLDAILPATLRRARSFLDENQRDFAILSTDVYRGMRIEWQKNGSVGPPPSYDEAIDRTKNLYILRIVNNFFSPFPAQFRSPYQFFSDAYHQLQEQARTEGRTQDWVDQQFVAKYGELYYEFAQSKSSNNLGLPATVEAVEAFESHEGLIGKYPFLARQIVGQAGEGEFSPEAYAYQLSETFEPGSSEKMRSVKDPVAAQKAAEANNGWRKYRQLTDKLDAAANEMGYNTHREVPALVELKRTYVDQLKAENMSWWEDYTSFDTDKFERQWIGVQEVAYAEELEGKPGIDTLRKYVELRNKFLEAKEQSEAEGVDVSDEALGQVFARYVGELVESDTRFSAEWFNGYLEFDPLLPDEGEPGAVTTDGP